MRLLSSIVLRILLLSSVMTVSSALAQDAIPPSEETVDDSAADAAGSSKVAITQVPPVKDERKLADEPPPESNAVVLQGLNKVTGRISRIEGPLGVDLRFGNLEIVARRCWKSPPEERPENAALLEIREAQQGEGSKKIFLGWMFSSSPGLSGLEHAVYDINMLSCEYHAPEVKKTAPEKKAESKDAVPAKKPSKSSKKPAAKNKKQDKQ